MSDTLQEARRRSSHNGELPFAIQLELYVDDRDVVAELEKHAEGAEREEFALEALFLQLAPALERIFRLFFLLRHNKAALRRVDRRGGLPRQRRRGRGARRRGARRAGGGRR